MLDGFLERLNFFFGNEFVRMFAFVLSSILAGYVLQPVPKWINNLFDTSHIFKFFILIFIGLGMSSQITLNNLVIILITATAISVLFEFMRYYDREYSLIPNINSNVPIVVNNNVTNAIVNTTKSKATTNAKVTKNVTRPDDYNQKPVNSQSGGSCNNCGTYLPYETGA